MVITAENAHAIEHEIVILVRAQPEPPALCDLQTSIYKALDYSQKGHDARAWFAGSYTMAIQVTTRQGADACAEYARRVLARLPSDSRLVESIRLR